MGSFGKNLKGLEYFKRASMFGAMPAVTESQMCANQTGNVGIFEGGGA
jgi:hypothetical protein